MRSRMNILVNTTLMMYAAMHLSISYGPGVECLPIAADRSEHSTTARFLSREKLQYIYNRLPEKSMKNYKQEMSKKRQSTLNISKNNFAIETIAKWAKLQATTDAKVTNEKIGIVDENSLSNATLTRLQTLLDCNERDFLPHCLQYGEYWVLKNYVRADHGPLLCHETVTYTTHATFNFLDNLQPLVERWMAPISIAIYAPGDDFVPTVRSIRYLRDCLDNDLIRYFVTFHIYFSNKHIYPNIQDPKKFLSVPYKCAGPPPFINIKVKNTYMKRKNLFYPINVARNIARDAALTHFILPSDIELYPSVNLVPQFLNMIARNAKPLNSLKRPRIFPINIFEVEAKLQVPSTKTELQAMLTFKNAVPFHMFVCPKCHNIPQRQQWINAAETNQMDVFHVGKRQGNFAHWEPIFIGTHQDPYYDNRLTWEGKKDKMTQGYILCVKDYDFMILNNAFLIHKPGIKHTVKNLKRDLLDLKQTAFIRKVIMPELKKLYGTRKGCSL